MVHKLLPIGIDDFAWLRREGYYYVDKSLIIKEILDRKSEVMLFTRPRRFGKTLNINMLQSFFELNDYGTEKLFQGLKIMSTGQRYLDHMGRYPVIALS